MEYESLTLEVSAKTAGYEVVKPPILRGRTGVDHKFSFVASSSGVNYAFDFYDTVDEIEVLKTYIKEFDTGAVVGIVCTGKGATDSAISLAQEYGMTVVSPEGLTSMFKMTNVAKSPRALTN